MRSRGKRLHEDFNKTYGGFIKDLDAQMKQGIEIPHCLSKTMLELRDKEGLDDLDMSMLASAFMVAGVESVSLVSTTVSA